MRVLMFGWELPPHNSGGLGVACHGIARALTDKDADVTFVLPRRAEVPGDISKVVFAPVEGGEGAREQNVGSVTVRGIDTPLQPYISAAEYEEYRAHYSEKLQTSIYGEDLFAEVLRYAKKARTIAQEESFDVIHAHDWLAFMAGVEAKRISGKPLVVHVHISGYEQSGGSGIDDRIFHLEQQGMVEADAIFAVSQHTKDILVATYGIDASKIYVVYNGIDAPSYQYRQAEEKSYSKEARRSLPVLRPGWNMVLYAGRLTLHKGPDHFLSAARRVLEYEPKTYFVVAGSGEMQFQIIRQAAMLGIADRVIFAGFARGEELKQLYHAADLFVLPSVTEPFGMTPLESLINGTPVLVSKQTGVSEVLHHALKTDFWDTDEMAHKMIMALRHPELTKQLGRYGKNEAVSQTWHKVAEKCIRVYDKLVGKQAANIETREHAYTQQ
jgi:glycosyltransferase involved in cell wall biosynthesis